jgi:hypothetical protein
MSDNPARPSRREFLAAGAMSLYTCSGFAFQRDPQGVPTNGPVPAPPPNITDQDIRTAYKNLTGNDLSDTDLQLAREALGSRPICNLVLPVSDDEYIQSANYAGMMNPINKTAEVARAMSSIGGGPGDQEEDRSQKAIINRNKLWKKGQTVLYGLANAFDPRIRTAVEAGLLAWRRVTGLNLTLQSSTQGANVTITSVKGFGHYSLLGTDCGILNLRRGTPAGESMNIDPGDRADTFHFTVLHELGHSLGFMHEHHNVTVQFHEAAVRAYFSAPPNKWNERQIRENILEKIQQGFEFHISEYDPLSIMHYWFPRNLIISPANVPDKPNEVLSQLDIKTAQLLYEVTSPPEPEGKTDVEATKPKALDPSTAQELKVGIPLKSSFTQYDQADVYKFEASNDDTYLVLATGGPHIRLQLFDSTDINGTPDHESKIGNGPSVLDGAIETTLKKGTHYIVARHGHPRGTGSYEIVFHQGTDQLPEKAWSRQIAAIKGKQESTKTLIETEASKIEALQKGLKLKPE